MARDTVQAVRVGLHRTQRAYRAEVRQGQALRARDRAALTPCRDCF